MKIKLFVFMAILLPNIIFAQKSSYTESDNDILDTLIAVSIILLILSLINEKFVQLIRKYSKISPKINRFNWLKNVNQPYTDNQELNEKRKKEINLLAILVGIAVAALSKASLFDLLTESNPQDVLFWSNENSKDVDGWFFVGIIFTGFFLSFGSKFFHDLLDTLYQTKEYRRKLQNKQLFDQRSYKDLIDFINTDSNALAKQALERHGIGLKQKYGSQILAVEIGNTAHAQLGLIVTLNGFTKPKDFPSMVPVLLPNGAKTMVAVETVSKRVGKAQFGLTCRLRNPEIDFDYLGAFGGVLVSDFNEDMKYVLSCSHVVLGGKSDNLGGTVNAPYLIDFLENDTTQSQGELVFAKLDENNDTALVALNAFNDLGWNNKLPDGSFLEEAISIDELNSDEAISYYSSRIGEFVNGEIHILRSELKVRLTYKDGLQRDFSNVVIVGNNSKGEWSTISDEGDSGAVLYTSNKNPFAMIIGGCKNFTYALPLTQLLKETKTKLYNQKPFLV